MLSIPISIYVFIISLIGCILLSIFNKKLKVNTVTTIEYIIWITSLIGIAILFLEYSS